MKKFYITFGQIHTHFFNGKTFDKDCVAEIEAKDMIAARKKAFDIFSSKWAFFYLEKPDMSYFPRGIFSIQ